MDPIRFQYHVHSGIRHGTGSAAHQTRNERGEPVFNPLRAYQEWAALYEKYAQRDRGDAQFSEEDLRVYLLLGWVAREKLDAGTMEAFASDMMTL